MNCLCSFCFGSQKLGELYSVQLYYPEPGMLSKLRPFFSLNYSRTLDQGSFVPVDKNLMILGMWKCLVPDRLGVGWDHPSPFRVVSPLPKRPHLLSLDNSTLMHRHFTDKQNNVTEILLPPPPLTIIYSTTSILYSFRRDWIPLWTKLSHPNKLSVYLRQYDLKVTTRGKS